MMIIKVITIHSYNFFILRSLKIFSSARTGYIQRKFFVIFFIFAHKPQAWNLWCDTHLGVLLTCVKILDGVHA
jgi:hypothetical protein